MKLYKFRPLANEDDFKRLKDILETGKFWCSKFSELNDPMEGFYAFLSDSHVPESIKAIYNEREQNKICSFSSEEAFSNPIMWGYYANGFRGVAIEIEVNSDKVEPIDYGNDDIPRLGALDPSMDAKKILTTKLPLWQHEYEYRFLEKSNSNDNSYGKEIKIGKITALYFGDPYRNAKDKEEIIKNSKALKKYIELRDDILKISKDFELYSVKIENCKVIKIPFRKKTNDKELMTEKVVTIFGTSRVKENDKIFNLAYELGRLLAEAGFTIANGGYGGTMLAAAKGARQTGGKIIGVTCRAFGPRKPNEFITQEIETDNLDRRIAKLIELGDAYVVLPGGTGTLLELAFIWELINKGFVNRTKPIILLTEFFKPLLDIIALDDKKSIELITIALTPEQAVKILKERF